MLVHFLRVTNMVDKMRHMHMRLRMLSQSQMNITDDKCKKFKVQITINLMDMEVFWGGGNCIGL